MKKWSAMSLADVLKLAGEAQERLCADKFIDDLIQIACPDGLPPGEIQVFDAHAPLSRRDALREVLGVMATKYYLSRPVHDGPTTKQALAQLEKISKASDRLIKAICPDGGEPSSWIQQRLLSAVVDKIGEIGIHRPKQSISLLGGVEIYPDANYLAEMVQALITLKNRSTIASRSVPEGARLGTVDAPLTAAFHVIIDAWSRVLDRPVKTSTTADTGEASGPLVDFVSRCLNQLEHDLMTHESIRDRVRRMFMDKAGS